MRLKNQCVEVSLTTGPGVPLLQARAFIFAGKGGEKQYGAWLCKRARHVTDVHNAIRQAWGERVRCAWIYYAPILGWKLECLPLGENYAARDLETVPPLSEAEYQVLNQIAISAKESL